MHQPKSPLQPAAGDLVAFDAWIRSLDRTRPTGHRWRKQFPWLETINIFGKLYIRRKIIAEFERRALAGEFKRNIRPVTPFLPQAGGPRKRNRKPGAKI